MAKKHFVFVDEAKLLPPKPLQKRFSALFSASAAIFHNFRSTGLSWLPVLRFLQMIGAKW